MSENMTGQIPPIAVRDGRVQTAVKGMTPDRVPFVPSLGNVYCLEYGVTIKEAMTDIRSVIPAMDQICREIDPDALFVPTFFPMKTMERLDSKCMGWPGSKPEFGDNAVYQVFDNSYLEDDDYEEFLKDPSRFLIQKVLARKYGALGGMSMFNPYALCGTTVLGFGALAAPPVKAALESMLDAARITSEYLQGMMELSMHAIQNGYPIWGDFVVMNPFDEFADNIRGLVNTVMDLKMDPDLLEEAVNRLADVTIPGAIAQGKMMHAKYAFIPLHAGVDEFMSPEDYHDYYWPPLKRLLDELIKNDITPMVMCEGTYYTRLETLKEIQKGKVVYFFEKQDMKKAKEELGGIACIAGNFDTGLLMHGTKEAVVEETKRLLDICAPGGGYIMSNSMSIDQCKRENLTAWYEAVMKYGKY
ncbi:MAG TPA: hypothetical protein IAA08_04255 [Candidatus Eubacterium avistercoris]|uniref:Uroporphyrinogen decarboxylase (URO-D) domain-containing protein n=1 Tax=Candidatus Eubacterium avistercoris TaxID=2838567 RepID=A0A9D2D2A3_9FIRM|nr:hypothetical protein [Candidatus Eubacterium avistercoris]